MSTELVPTPAPEAWIQAGWLTMISGVATVLTAGVWLLASVVSIYGLCCCFVPLGMAGVGAWETWLGYRMSQGEIVPRARQRTLIRGVVGLVLCVGVVSVFFDALTWALLGRDEVVAWLDANGA